MPTFQVRSNKGTVARIQTAPTRVFKVTGSARGPRGLSPEALNAIAGYGISITGTFPNLTFSATGSYTVLNVHDYGAVGDGIADDTNAIRAAIVDAHANNGSVVFFPKGLYIITDTLNLLEKVSLVGVGSGSSLIQQLTDDINTLEMIGTGVVAAESSIVSLGFIGTGSGTGDGIHIAGEPLAYVSLTDVSSQQFGGTGVYLGGAIVSRLERVLATSNLQHGIWIDGTDSFVTSVALIACYGNNNNMAGIFIKKATYVQLSGCASDSNGIGYYFLSVFGLSVNGSGAESSQSHGVADYTGISFKIEGDVVFGANAIEMAGCYSYDTHDLGFLVTGTALGVSLISCMDNQAHAGATASIQTDVGTSVSLVGCTFTSAKVYNGSVVTLNDDSGVSTIPNLFNTTIQTQAIRNTDNKNALTVESNATAVNNLRLRPASTGQAVTLTAEGTDTDIYFNLVSKGAGTIRANGVDVKRDTMTTNKLLGRGTAGTGAIEELTLGTGLSIVGTTLNAAASLSSISRTVVVTSGNVTAGAAANTDYVYIISGAHTVTLPTCVSNTNLYTLKNSHTVNVSLAFTSSQTADGGGITLAPSESVSLISNNTEWKIV